ncbi:SIMPL domain-containing protein [Cohnella silvisoli]|uniref:SIMPL domain-containing protein n=1 Tax=Cohnella silvisoli TaxID=2873699 RepID=A0ABV1L1U9_9BACL|nr:SIMPL domain-containing protein [Cohnella silvisoli]MCD9025186.1 SIMPL domain-containing protein [Cohnella silvisoli]
MKNRTLQVLMVTMAAVVIGWFGFGRGAGDVVSAESSPAATTPPYTVTVGASGSIMVEPDVAYLNLAVETRGTKAADAQQANADKFAGVEKTLYEKFAIDKKDVKTTGFNVQPEYNYTEKDGQVLKGYIAVHSIQVTYRKLPEIGKLFDALTAAGANRLDGVQFATEKNDQYELDALKKAMTNAAAKAGVLATSANRQLKGVVNIVQGDVSSNPILYVREQAKMQMNDMAASGASSSVQSGQIEIRTQVTVQYEMQ